MQVKIMWCYNLVLNHVRSNSVTFTCKCISITPGASSELILTSDIFHLVLQLQPFHSKVRENYGEKTQQFNKRNIEHNHPRSVHHTHTVSVFHFRDPLQRMKNVHNFSLTSSTLPPLVCSLSRWQQQHHAGFCEGDVIWKQIILSGSHKMFLSYACCVCYKSKIFEDGGLKKFHWECHNNKNVKTYHCVLCQNMFSMLTKKNHFTFHCII